MELFPPSVSASIFVYRTKGELKTAANRKSSKSRGGHARRGGLLQWLTLLEALLGFGPVVVKF